MLQGMFMYISYEFICRDLFMKKIMGFFALACAGLWGILPIYWSRLKFNTIITIIIYKFWWLQ